jgi:sugar/nucleoside kinase (ribokinase family)
MVFDGDAITPVAAVPTKAIDTNGAGDMFAGAFLYGITSGKNYIWSAKLGNSAAAKVVAQFGPRLDVAEFELIEQSTDTEAVLRQF